MKVKIDHVHGHGDASEERVLLSVVDDCNMKYYMVADTSFTADGRISNKHRHVHWFQSVAVKKGERISLHTKPGAYQTTVSGGVKWHHFYFGLKTPIWNDDGDAAVLFEVNNWKTTKARP
ncbi:hypothetical protein [Pseudomonas sp. Kh13]|uniref:hypothetical protein n=1 Tax=Pseudomonas sp. Kh13 TaxID=2093744 RepID=UPI0011836DEA|nr:hypothetical protein [Pseudomonas sp. Kh13]